MKQCSRPTGQPRHPSSDHHSRPTGRGTLCHQASRARRHQCSPAGGHELQAAVRGSSPACQPFGADEFVGRVAERVGVEPQAAWTQVRAVLGTLEREVAEMEEVRQRLPREFDALLA